MNEIPAKVSIIFNFTYFPIFYYIALTIQSVNHCAQFSLFTLFTKFSIALVLIIGLCADSAKFILRIIDEVLS